MTADQILEFLEEFQTLLSSQPEKCVLISLKVEPSLLKAFKRKAQMEGLAYQTQIKKLMREWLKQ